MRLHLFTVLTCASLSTAHFVLRWPTNAGFEDDLEPKGPCGGFEPAVIASTPNVTVDQFAVQIFSTHPAGQWGFSATPNIQEPYNFVEIAPIVNTTGAGGFCLQHISVPSDWAGESGVIQVIDHSSHELLYQCAAVNFVSGSNDTAGPACTNASNFQATWTNMRSLNGSTDLNGTGAANSTTSTSTVTAHGDAAMATVAGSLLGGLGLLAVGFAF